MAYVLLVGKILQQSSFCIKLWAWLSIHCRLGGWSDPFNLSYNTSWILINHLSTKETRASPSPILLDKLGLACSAKLSAHCMGPTLKLSWWLVFIICTTIQPVQPQPQHMRCYVQNQHQKMFPCSNELIPIWLLSNIEMFCWILRLNKQTRYVACTQIFFNENFWPKWPLKGRSCHSKKYIAAGIIFYGAESDTLSKCWHQKGDLGTIFGTKIKKKCLNTGRNRKDHTFLRI